MWVLEANFTNICVHGIGWIFDGKDSRSNFTIVQVNVFGGSLYSNSFCWSLYPPDRWSTSQVLVAPFVAVSRICW
jgi:hypothetical protein